MTRVAWYEFVDEDRRIASAQMIVWLACLGPMLGLGMAVVGIFFGNRTLITAMAANPLGVLLGFAWVGIYVVAGYLIGERRASGGIIGLALFVYSLVTSALSRRLVSWDAALAVVGIVLILRAGGALRLPFWPGARPPAAPPGESTAASQTAQSSGQGDQAGGPEHDRTP